MTKRFLVPGLALTILMTGCGDARSDGDTVTSVDLDQRVPGEAAKTPPPPPAPRVNDGKPDLTPATLTPEAERTEKGARNVVLSFARAIELKAFDQAWAMMSDADQAKWSKAEFTRMFTDLSNITVASPTGTIEGAAGSSYYTAPLTITANDTNGRPVAYDGTLVLRRANDVPGASAEDLRWHIYRTTLDWTH